MEGFAANFLERADYGKEQAMVVVKLLREASVEVAHAVCTVSRESK